MKKIILLMLLSNSLFAQTNYGWEMIRIPKHELVYSKDGISGLYVFMMQYKTRSFVINVKAFGKDKCIDSDSKMTITFRDSTRAIMLNELESNCNNNFAIFFNGRAKATRKFIENLKTKPIQSIRIETIDSYVEETLSLDESEFFKHIITYIDEYY